MELFSYFGLFQSLLDIVREIRDKVVGYDEQISDKFDRVIAKALKSYVKDDDQYIRNVMIHTSELTDMIVRVIDDESSLMNIETPSYIAPNEFRSIYDEAKRDKELWRDLQTKWNEYKNKSIDNNVKAIYELVVENKEEIQKGFEKNKKVSEEIKKDIAEMKADIGGIKADIGEIKDKREINDEIPKEDPIKGLYKCLNDKLDEKRKHHPSFRLMDIDASLFPNGMVTFDTEARDFNNEKKKVKEIVTESWERGETNHLMIEGEGGIGKTVTLLSLPDNFAPHPIPAIYIPLHELKEETNTIKKYIKNRVLDSEEQYDLMQEVVKKPWNKGPHLLLLLDGFNEIPVELRGKVSEDIEQWSEKPGLQIITSSRFDIHQYVALRSSFSKIELQPLSEERVSEYLVNNKIGVPDNPAVIKLITIPLLLTLYIKAEAIRNDRPSPFAKFKETKNAGLLIWNYLQCELWPFRNKKAEAKACVLALEFIAPYIAWTMQQHSEFVLDESTFFDRIDEAYHLLNSHVEAHGQLPDHIKTTLRQSPGLPSIEHIGDLLKEHLCLFINNEGEYRLMHQQFRDALAAMHLINLSYLSSNSLPQEWNTPIDHYVMQFVVDLISEDEATQMWEQNRNTKLAIDDATRNQLRLQGLLHNNDFSHLDFSGLDLRNISLYPYRYGRAILKLPTQQARMLETKISKKTFSPEGHESFVRAVVVTPNGKRIISGSDDHTIRVWDMESGAAIGKPIEGHKNYVTAVAVTPDGKRIVSGSDDHTVRVWDMETGAAIGKPFEGHEGPVTAVAVTPDGKRIVSGSDDRTIRVWDLTTGEAIGKPIEGHKNYVTAVAVTPDGKRIVSGSRDNTVRVWNLETGAAIGKPFEGHEGPVTAVAVTPDGKRIVSGSWDRSIRVWDLETGASIGNPIKGHIGWVETVAVTPDGKRIVSRYDDNTIRVCDLESGTAIGKPIEGHIGWMETVAVTPDGKCIISGYDDRTIRVWDLETGAAIGKPIEGHEFWVLAVAVSPDGKRIVSGSGDNTIRVWDMETGEAIGNPIEGHENSVKAVAVTPDGKRIFSVSLDKTIRVWDLETGAPIGYPIEGHGIEVYAVTVTPDGKRRIFSESKDSTICITDMETREVRKIKVHPLSFVGLDFSKAIISTPELKETLRQNGAKV